MFKLFFLPKKNRYEFQMQYSSIGWSIGALLGYAQATKKRCIACIGDGSFQVSLFNILSLKCKLFVHKFSYIMTINVSFSTLWHLNHIIDLEIKRN